MKAIQVRSTGGPEVLELRALPDRVPQTGEVLVRVTDAIFTMYKTGQLKLLAGLHLKGCWLGPQRSGEPGNDRKACALD
jgi:NADPH:quinone reductase-like Zn-dependent oxidoreductase